MTVSRGDSQSLVPGAMRFRRLLRIGAYLLRYFGPRWLAYRVWYALWARTGRIERKLPVRMWTEQPLADFLTDCRLADPIVYAAYRRTSKPVFFFNGSDRQCFADLFARWDAAASPVPMADSIRKGILTYFGHAGVRVGFPPDWHANPFTGQKAPKESHWSRIDDFGFGDIKVIWEPSRFGFTYVLVRAYWRTGDESYAECFWRLVEDWHTSNQPQTGPNWKCGQEVAFRVMAWVFGLYGFLDAPSSTPERLSKLAQMIAVSGERIAGNLDYALSQGNNHGISEAVGLWTIGLLFPELRNANRWRANARKILESLGRELIYEDGTFSQHSLNYQRLMLHDYLWALRLGDINGEPFSAGLRHRVCRAASFLYQAQDDETGAVPCYGSNDGALILPLNNCRYDDYRPVIHALSYLETGARCYEGGPWDEDLLWIFGPAATEAPVLPLARQDMKAIDGGCYALRSTSGFAFTHCGTYRHRPGHADMLHVDLWWRGQNLAPDAGTYSYNAPAPWDDLFAGTGYHNTVSVDERSQMDRWSRFMWLPWAQGKVHDFRRSTNGILAYWEGSHDGYERLKQPVVHRRAILCLGEIGWLVLDALCSAGPHRYRLHWLLAEHSHSWDAPNRHVVLDTPQGPFGVQAGVLEGSCDGALHRADEESPVGWRSRFYQQREPALGLELSVHGCNARYWSLLGPHPFTVQSGPNVFLVASALGNVEIQLAKTNEKTLVSQVSLSGSLYDHLRMQ